MDVPVSSQPMPYMPQVQITNASTACLPKTTSLPLYQSEIGEECKFQAFIKERPGYLVKHDQMHYGRPDQYFQLGINFDDRLVNLHQLHIRITPSWDVHRAESASIIYCCERHRTMQTLAGSLEAHSMLSVRCTDCVYEFDEATGRLSARIPLISKEVNNFFWINVKSKCFSTCFSTLKRQHQVLTVTLEQIDTNQVTKVLGRKLFNVKFSSSPKRDMMKAKDQQSLEGQQNARKRGRQTRNPIDADVKRRPLEIGDATSQCSTASIQSGKEVVLIAVPIHHVDKVKKYLQSLECDPNAPFPTTPIADPSRLNFPDHLLPSTEDEYQKVVQSLYSTSGNASVGSSPAIGSSLDDLDVYLQNGPDSDDALSLYGGGFSPKDVSLDNSVVASLNIW